MSEIQRKIDYDKRPWIYRQADHEHEWVRTGEYFATLNPIWFEKCECGATREVQDPA